MFMNYKHERLIHNAVPNKDGVESDVNENLSPVKSESKDFAYLFRPKPPKPVITDLPLNKDKSMLTVNVSPIAGIQFLNPVEKKQNKPPYIEIFTRVYDTPKPSYAGKKLNILSNSLIKKKDKIQITNQTMMPNILPKANSIFPNPLSTKVAPKAMFLKKIEPPPNIINKLIIDNKPEKVQPVEIVESGNEVTMQCDSNKAIIEENHPSTSASNIQQNIEHIDQNEEPKIIIKIDETQLPNPTTDNYVTDDRGRGREQRVTMTRNSKLINTLKAKVDAQQRRISRLIRLKQLTQKKESASDFQPMSKASLYAQIVPYLSPQLAQTVHKEMFPTFYKS